MKNVRVADLMTRDVVVIRSDQDVHELERLLLKQRIHGVPVVDRQDRFVGVVSQTDLLAWHYEAGVDGASFYDPTAVSVQQEGETASLRVADVRSAKVEEVMSPVIHCIGPDRPIAVAAARMINRRIHRLIVVDSSARVLGLLSALDVLRALPDIDAVLESDDEATVC